MTMRSLFFFVLLCLSCFLNEQVPAYARFYSAEAALNLSSDLYIGTIQSKKVHDNHFFSQLGFGVASKKNKLSHYLFSYGYGKHKNLNSTSKLSILVSLTNYFQFNQTFKTSINVTPSYMKRISPKASYNIGFQIPMLQFQDSYFSDTVITVTFNKFIGSGLSHRESSRYVKSIKKKFLWFWINDK